VGSKTKTFKTVFSLVWAVGMGVALYLWIESDLELQDVPQVLNDWLSTFGVLNAALIYVVLYTIRPLILFPATVLTVAAGLIFGPWLGILFTIIGENVSANFAFAIARWLGRSWVGEREVGTLANWDARIRDNALTSVLIMRLVYLPFDAVNYGCGLTSMRQRDFFIGTFIGIMPGLVSFVLLGGSGAAGVENRLVLFASALAFFFLGLIVARAMRKYAPESEEAPEQ